MSSGRPTSRTLARALRRLPLFPLEDVVLFPYSMIPLYVFEARYRKMVRDVLASNRLIAISLQLEKEDPAADGGVELHPVGGVLPLAGHAAARGAVPTGARGIAGP